MNNYNQMMNNDDVKKISYSVLNKYNKLLSKDELEQCRCIGIWKASKKYLKDKSKLTTFVYNYVNWECLKLITENKSKRNIVRKQKDMDGIDLFSQLSLILPKEQYDIIHKRFVENMTIKEIALSNNTSISDSNKSLKKSMASLKRIFT